MEFSSRPQPSLNSVKPGLSQEPGPLYFHLAALQFFSSRMSLLLPSSPHDHCTPRVWKQPLDMYAALEIPLQTSSGHTPQHGQQRDPGGKTKLKANADWYAVLYL